MGKVGETPGTPSDGRESQHPLRPEPADILNRAVLRRAILLFHSVLFFVLRRPTRVEENLTFWLHDCAAAALCPAYRAPVARRAAASPDEGNCR